jgi:putative DNA primase/helicase
MEIKEIKQGVDIVKVIGEAIPLKQKGGVHKGSCPFHNEKSPSFAVYEKKQTFKCFGCGEFGDVIDFLVKYKNIDKVAAIRFLESGSILDQYKYEAKPEVKKSPLEYITPAPQPPTTIRHRDNGSPTAVWTYKNEKGELLFYVCRFQTPDGKEILPFTPWRTETGREVWRFLAPPAPRPMFGLDTPDTGQTIGLFEGEKTVKAAQLLFPHIKCMGWQGGGNAIHMTDWRPLHGRKVLIFPDADGPGVKTAQQIYEMIKDECPVVKAVNFPIIKKGWDFADWEGTSAESIDWAKKNVVEVVALVAPVYPKPALQVETEPSPAVATEPSPSQNGQQAPPEEPETKQKPSKPERRRESTTDPYRSLGYESSDNSLHYWFLSHATQTILKYKSASLGNEHTVCEIAPANFWQENYSNRGGKLNLSFVAERLRGECVIAGFFSSENIRGRGAWLDSGQVVIHTGKQIQVGKQTIDLINFQSRYAYQSRPNINLNVESQLSSLESAKFQELINCFAWDRSIYAQLIAGWCVIAPIAGALDWRPHIWVTGAAGSGKSWILQNVIRRVMGDFCIALQSNTTEPGVRGALEGDAIPVIIDEMEAESESANERVQAIIAFARSASSSDGGGIAKGSQKGGKATSYAPKSAFCFASISPVIQHESDLQRITTISLGVSGPDEKTSNLKKVHALLTDDYIEKFQGRIFMNLESLLANIETFSRAAGQVIGNTRAGAQIGPMLAGAYLLKRTDTISLEKAIEWVEKQDWKEQIRNIENQDETRLLSAILEKPVRIEGKVSTERTIGELIYVSTGTSDSLVTVDIAIEKLLRLGINSVPEGIYISLSAQEIKRTILKGTQWASSYAKVLSRVKGAREIENVKFSAGVQSRAIFIPKSNFTNGN